MVIVVEKDDNATKTHAVENINSLYKLIENGEFKDCEKISVVVKKIDNCEITTTTHTFNRNFK